MKSKKKYIQFLLALMSSLTILAIEAKEDWISIEEMNQEGLLLYNSSEQILKLENISGHEIFIPEYNKTLKDGEDYHFNHGVQQVVLSSESSEGNLIIHTEKAVNAKGYTQSAYVSDKVWAEITPYLMPENHPIKRKLDKIFSESRVTATRKTIEKAGFQPTKQQGIRVIASTHKNLKGYVIKIYPDDNCIVDEAQNFMDRVKGSLLVKKTIKKYKLEKYFAVPRKWIYPLPDKPLMPAYPWYHRKNFILVVEDMKLNDPKTNHKKWRRKTTPSLLEKVFLITEKTGLRDSLRVENLAWTKTNKLAFVDTEFHLKWPIDFHPLFEYLNRSNREYWSKLIEKAKKE